VEARRVARLDPQDAAGERLLADDLLEAPVEHELHALLAGAELHAARERRAVRADVGAGDGGPVTHQGRRELARAHPVDAGVLRRDRSGPDVGDVAELEDRHGASSARDAAGAVGAGDPAKRT
jgi:hypothetical protein